MSNKQEEDLDQSKHSSPKVESVKNKKKDHNLSVVIVNAAKKISADEPFSPIKTTGFDCKSAGLDNNYEANIAKSVAETMRLNRNYAYYRQNRKSLII